MVPMLKIIVVTKSPSGKKFGAAVVGFPIMKFRSRVSTAKLDAQQIAERLKAEGHTVEIRYFV
jgi:hypothetical protein